MSNDLEKIVQFINEHHVMSLATATDISLDICSVFYAYDEKSNSFVFASDKDTKHIQNIQHNPMVSANILLETKEIGKIQGLQIHAKCFKVSQNNLKKLYFLKYPYALAMNPTLYKLDIKDFKYTDNRLGFSKKIKLEF
jgi:uncharacterized protein YhbP (UPF0306 family)